MLLGIDLGTTHVKAVLLDPDSLQPAASAVREVTLHTPRPGWAEQHPGDWWRAAIQTIGRVIEQTRISPHSIQGIGLSGQMHGTVCVNAEGRAVAPAIIWADTRSKDQADALIEQVDIKEMARRAPGWPAAGYMGPTLMWLREHNREILQQTHQVVLPKDYVRYHLTDELATDPSDAAATWLFDIETGAWSEQLIEWCGIAGRWLPPVAAPWDGTRLARRAAELLNVRAGIPVTTGAADCAAQMLGHGVLDPGTVLTIIGTGGQVVIPLGSPRRDPQLRTYTYNHAAPDRWYAQAAILAGGLALRWLRDMLGMKRRADAYEHLSALAAEVPPGAEGLLFIPHLAGARRMQGGASASGAFSGLRLHHGPGHLARAVMEGVAFAMRECLEVVLSLADAPGVQVIVSGGAMASLIWRQIQADVTRKPLHLAAGENHACIGAALLGGVAAGVYGSVAEACALLPKDLATIEPNTAASDLYQEHYERFKVMASKLEGNPPV